MSDAVVRLKHQFYVHVHDNNLNITSLICGPSTITLASHQTLLSKKPEPFHIVLPQQYAVIENSVQRDKNGVVVLDKHGQAKNSFGEREIRFFEDPFPLYPEEKLIEIKNLTVLTATQALVLKASRKFTDGRQAKAMLRNAGDEYLFTGPGTYIPRVEEDAIELRDAVIVKFNESLKLRAKNKFTDASGVERRVGEDYLWTSTGAYLVGVDETLVAVIKAVILTQQKAVHVEVVKAYYDDREWAKIQRRPGEVYLVTNEMTDAFTPQPMERVVVQVPLITVNRKQWAVILDPVGDDGKPQLGSRKVVTNQQFFLKPGESLEKEGVRDIYVLAEDEALLLVALEEFTDVDRNPSVNRSGGEQWLLHGPRDYIPKACVKVFRDKSGTEKRRRLVLSEGEGVYVRDIQSGGVRAILGQTTYMLKAYEELWEKTMKPVVEEKIAQQLSSHGSYLDHKLTGNATRDLTKVVSFRVPHNSVTQVYDFEKRTQRTIFGPNLVLLHPEEEFTVLSLSGSDWDPTRPSVCLPKQTGRIKALYLFLGPASLSDVVNVETMDHARLALQLSYDWHFDVAPGNKEQADVCFSLPDFVGDCCSCIASRVRSSIASVSFENFHKHSNKLVQAAVFGVDAATNQPRTELRFANRLVVTSVDIQEIDVVDQNTKDALRQSVKMAIEITTQAQEAAARQEASVREQQARGKLERQTIADKSESESVRIALLELQTQCAAISSTGQAKAEAKARAEAAEIEGDQAVAVARTKAKSSDVMDAAQQDIRIKKGNIEISYHELRDTLEVSRTKELSDVESGKLGRVMEAVGKNTVTAMAKAGPELQSRLLKSLGLEGYLVTDGTNPINLFNTAKGLTESKKS